MGNSKKLKNYCKPEIAGSTTLSIKTFNTLTPSIKGRLLLCRVSLCRSVVAPIAGIHVQYLKDLTKLLTPSREGDCLQVLTLSYIYMSVLRLG
jgi:hypothetical protein